MITGSCNRHTVSQEDAEEEKIGISTQETECIPPESKIEAKEENANKCMKKTWDMMLIK